MSIDRRLDRATAIAAGLTLGTAPMLWHELLAIGPLHLRSAHLAGLVTLMLVLTPGTTARIQPAVVVGLGAIGGLTVLGAAANAVTHTEAFWPTSELLRFVANLLIALAVVSALPTEPGDIRRCAWATCAGLTASLVVWLGAIQGTSAGLAGAVEALISGRTHQLLYDIQLPAMRSLHHDSIELGARHSTVFGFLVSAAVLRLLAESIPTDRGLRWTARLLGVVVLATTLLSSSRSALAALAIAGVSYVVSRRAELVTMARTYVVAASCAAIGATALASSVVARFTRDTDSFRQRQLNVSSVLEAEWSVLGLPALPAGAESPHNSFVEMAAGGGVLALLAVFGVVSIACAGVWPRRSTKVAVVLLAAVVLVRCLTAARGSLDTAALLALAIVLVSVPIPVPVRARHRARATTSSRPIMSASADVTG